MQRETECLKQICHSWNQVLDIVTSLDIRKIPPELLKKYKSIDQRTRRLAENWNPDISKARVLNKLIEDSKAFIDQWNHCFSK
jgi:hypothetical protein